MTIYARALPRILRSKIARIGEISKPPSGGIKDRKILRYGSVIGLKKAIAL
jgi:hypothetical protein